MTVYLTVKEIFGQNNLINLTSRKVAAGNQFLLED